MTDLDQLEQETLQQISQAHDETALEAARLAALGKKGAISALLATLGKMSPEQRKTEGARINALKEKATLALAAKRDELEEKTRGASLFRSRHLARGWCLTKSIPIDV